MMCARIGPGGRALALAVFCAALPVASAGQTVSHRGFVEARGIGFPQEAPNDTTQLIADVLVREEVFLRPAEWFQLGAGIDLRANSHDEVEDEWRFDWEDRRLQRPRVALRRLALTLSRGGFALDVGKQFIRWGRADIVYPTDRFAPRDFLNVIGSELLPVIAVRPAVQIGSESFEAVWAPQLTPSRLPLLDQRWAPVPAGALSLRNADYSVPRGTQLGVRWRHTGERLETAVAFFDGFNHLPDIDVNPAEGEPVLEVRRIFPTIRMYGGDVAVPSGWFTLKGEVAYVTSPPGTSDEYVLYVVEFERQVGEWLLDAGYVGETVTESRVPFVFSPDRQLAKSIIGRAAYTVDPQRTVVIEGAARQGGEGFYGKVEYSQALGSFWRLTAAGVALAGDDDDFIGQYQHNSHASIAVRFSF